VIGSVVTAVYRDGIRPTAAILPEPVRDAVADSISGAYGLSGRLGPAEQSVADAVNEAFVNALQWTAVAATGTAAVAAVMVLFWMPGRPITPPARHEQAAGGG
jgi:hypothetical protein